VWDARRDPATGEPTGILKDRAMELVWAVIPKLSDEEEGTIVYGVVELIGDTHIHARWVSDACLEAAMSHVLKHGVTSIHHMSYTWNDVTVFKRFATTPCVD
jgi:predicted amidohydrolase YtcJ